MTSIPFSAAAPAPANACLKPTHMPNPRRSIRIAVVGDVHDQWDLERDAKALHLLQADLVLFTGDFGNENVKLVENVSKLEIPKAIILGNHDAWGTYEFSRKKKNCVHLQLEILKEQHVGFRRLEFPLLELSIVGGRPFSCGGDKIFRPRLLSSMYGVHNMEDSRKKICEIASRTTSKEHPVILLAHNGPTGLGSKADDICGRDWVHGGGDHGDPDLGQALSHLKRSTDVSIPLVVFGHMHKELALGNGVRKMIVVGDDGTVYLNGAVVPRVKCLQEKATTTVRPTSSQSGESPCSRDGSLRAFTLVEIRGGIIKRISEIWVSVAVDGDSDIAEESILYETAT